MIMTNNPKVKYLVDETIKKSGSDFTSAISDLGDGNMGRGLINLWKDGENNGLAKGVVGTSMVFGLCIGACVLVQKAIHKHRVKQAIAEMVKDSELGSTPVALEDMALTDTETEQANESNEHPTE